MPSSPLPVATAESNGSSERVIGWVGVCMPVIGRVAGRRHHMRPASRGSQRSASRVTFTVVLDDALGLLLDLRRSSSRRRGRTGS